MRTEQSYRTPDEQRFATSLRQWTWSTTTCVCAAAREDQKTTALGRSGRHSSSSRLGDRRVECCRHHHRREDRFGISSLLTTLRRPLWSLSHSKRCVGMHVSAVRCTMAMKAEIRPIVQHCCSISIVGTPCLVVPDGPRATIAHKHRTIALPGGGKEHSAQKN